MRATIARHTVEIPHAGDQSDFRISRQTSPVFESTLGWKMRVTKVTFGGVNGYSEVTSMFILNLPPNQTFKITSFRENTSISN